MDDLFSGAQAIFQTTPTRWAGIAQTFPLELLTRVPAPGEWSALECLQHFLDAELVFHTLLRAFQAGRDSPACNPDEEGTPLTGRSSPAEMSARFASLRAETLSRLAAFTPGDYERRVRHAQLGMVSLGEMVAVIAAHDLMHMVQAERAMMQPYIASCGPWKIFFTDHIAAGS